jgi:hypothetical protein
MPTHQSGGMNISEQKLIWINLQNEHLLHSTAYQCYGHYGLEQGASRHWGYQLTRIMHEARKMRH